MKSNLEILLLDENNYTENFISDEGLNFTDEQLRAITQLLQKAGKLKANEKLELCLFGGTINKHEQLILQRRQKLAEQSF